MTSQPSASARPPNSLRDLGNRVLVDVEQGEFCAGAAKDFRGGGADAPGSSGDDCDVPDQGLLLQGGKLRLFETSIPCRTLRLLR